MNKFKTWQMSFFQNSISFGKTVPMLLFVLTLFIFSCELYDPSGTGNFWTTDTRTNMRYRIQADLVWVGEFCEIWAERGSGLSYDQISHIANAYDDLIYKKLMKVFDIEIEVGEGIFLNPLQYADSLSLEPDGKLCILLLDIRDNYQKGVHESYVAGFFWPGDLLDIARSNQRDMIYIDINPGIDNIDVLIDTLAHETQHLINFVVRRAFNLPRMETWIDEGLASAAEFLYKGTHLEDRLSWFNNNGRGGNSNIKGLIDLGNNFYVWNNRMNESEYAILDDYATVYLFFQWLRIQSDSSNIYKDILTSRYPNQKVINAMGYSRWEDLLEDWLAANYINATSGLYGYKGELTLTRSYVPAGRTSVFLFPGEGVYSYSNSNELPASIGNIRYLGLDTVPKNSINAGDTRLTFNVNENRAASSERGETTGAVPPVTGNLAAGSRTLQYSDRIIGGPYRIGAEFIRESADYFTLP
jgi:hypothetical protein